MVPLQVVVVLHHYIIIQPGSAKLRSLLPYQRGINRGMPHNETSTGQ
jgi:hypothetical protein